MKVLVFRNAEEGSQYAANMLLNKLRAKNNLVVGLATGSTPQKMYNFLVADHQQNKTSWAGVTSYNLDEYKGYKREDKDSYQKFMDDNLFNFININRENIFFPNKKNCNTYDEMITEKGGIDVQILGIGVNGHIGFNEPGSKEYCTTRLVNLTQETINTNAKFFEGNVKNVPKEAYTMGLKTIMQAKEIILLAFGKEKSNAIRTVLAANEYNANCPATILIKHPNVTVIVDPEVDLGM